MPRYLIERTFPDLLESPITDQRVEVVQGVVDRNAEFGVTWIHSYVNEDKNKTFCVCDAPDPEAIRKAADCNALPVDRINRVTALDPYFYK